MKMLGFFVEAITNINQTIIFNYGVLIDDIKSGFIDFFKQL
jgi:hypothetical protein